MSSSVAVLVTPPGPYIFTGCFGIHIKSSKSLKSADCTRCSGGELGDSAVNREHWNAQGILELTGLVENMTEQARESQDLGKAWRTGKVTAEGGSQFTFYLNAVSHFALQFKAIPIKRAVYKLAVALVLQET